MSTASKRLFTPDEYLAREIGAKFKSEYYRGEIYAMAGASWEHVLINDNLVREIGNRLRKGPCVLLSRDLRVKVSATGLYTYPDGVILCDKPQFEDSKFDQPSSTLLNPKVIIEVLSPSTEGYDRGDKFGQYRTIPSFAEYILVSQDQPLVERFVRHNKDWVLTEFRGLDAICQLGTLEIDILLEEIYLRVEFPPAPPRAVMGDE